MKRMQRCQVYEGPQILEVQGRDRRKLHGPWPIPRRKSRIEVGVARAKTNRVRDQAGHGISQHVARAPALSLLFTREAEAQLHDPPVEKRMSEFQAERTAQAVEEFHVTTPVAAGQDSLVGLACIDGPTSSELQTFWDSRGPNSVLPQQ